MEEQRKKIFKPTNEVCEIHEATKVQAGNLEPFCPVCAHEATRKRRRNYSGGNKEGPTSKDKRWLKEASILIDKTMFSMTFENFKEMDEETAANKEKALNIARRLYKGSTSNELLSGRFGTGKTHLAMAILNQLNEHQNKKHLFISIDELLLRIKASYGGGGAGITEEQALHLISKADVVVIDDLGAGGRIRGQTNIRERQHDTNYKLDPERTNKQAYYFHNEPDRQRTNSKIRRQNKKPHFSEA